jgi:ribosome-binding protein aMBF1 (putative translation factor)
MIKNERQYRITKAQVERFRRALSQVDDEPCATDLHPLLRKAREDALRSQLEELVSEIAEYEALRSGKCRVLTAESFGDLPRVLIRARIATGLSQKDLAERLNLKEQQVQHYEATEYASASIGRVKEVVDALGVRVREDVFLP